MREVLTRYELGQCDTVDIDTAGCKFHTLRFWYYVNDGYTKLTLHPGQVLRLICGGAHEEGYSWQVDELRHVGTHIERISSSWGRDCDGRHENSTTSVCRPSDIASLPTWEESESLPHDPSVRLPQWRREDSITFDEYAELSGY